MCSYVKKGSIISGLKGFEKLQTLDLDVGKVNDKNLDNLLKSGVDQTIGKLNIQMHRVVSLVQLKLVV